MCEQASHKILLKNPFWFWSKRKTRLVHHQVRGGTHLPRNCQCSAFTGETLQGPNLFINGAEETNCVYNTKLFRIIRTKAICEGKLNNLAALSGRVTKWQMKFNVDKYKVMYLGKNNPNYTYILTGSQFAIAIRWWDLGVTVNSFLEVSAECSVVVKNQLLCQEGGK